MDINELKLANYLIPKYKLNENDNEDDGLVKIYYSDLDIKTRAEVLKSIEFSNPMIDIFGDDLIKHKIEDGFKNKPLFITH